VSNLSLGSGSHPRWPFKGSPAHVGNPSGPAHRSGIRPVIHRRPLGGVATSPVVSCRLSATGISFLGILFPLGNSAFLTVGLPGSTWTLTGFPRFARARFDRGGCPLYPGAVVLSRLVDVLQPAPAAFAGGQPYTPLNHPI
jgi:hypothetical protein